MMKSTRCAWCNITIKHDDINDTWLGLVDSEIIYECLTPLGHSPFLVLTTALTNEASIKE